MFLRYCTWYHDQKAPEAYHPLLPGSFYQFRWPDVYRFLEGYQSSNPLVAAFLVLLEEYRMNKLPDLAGEDLIAMRQIGSTILKMDECFDIVKPLFIQLFDEPYERDYERLKEIPESGRYAMYRSGMIKGAKDSEISISFEFEVENPPALCVQCYCEGPSRFIFKQAITNNNLENLRIEESDEWDYYVAWFEKPLSDFIESSNQFKDITDWFIEKMKWWAEFMRQDKTMKWVLPRK